MTSSWSQTDTILTTIVCTKQWCSSLPIIHGQSYRRRCAQAHAHLTLSMSKLEFCLFCSKPEWSRESLGFIMHTEFPYFRTSRNVSTTTKNVYYNKMNLLLWQVANIQIFHCCLFFAITLSLNTIWLGKFHSNTTMWFAHFAMQLNKYICCGVSQASTNMIIMTKWLQYVVVITKR